MKLLYIRLFSILNVVKFNINFFEFILVTILLIKDISILNIKYII